MILVFSYGFACNAGLNINIDKLLDNEGIMWWGECFRVDGKFHNKHIFGDIFNKFDGIDWRIPFIVRFGIELHKEREPTTIKSIESEK